MREIFRKLATEIEDAFIIPTYQELRENFPHAQGCTGGVNLTLTKKPVFYPGVGPYGISDTFDQNFLKCDLCGVEKQCIVKE